MSNRTIERMKAKAGGAEVTQNRRSIYLVLGMHRSGTSVIARSLEALGIHLGDNLIEAAAGDNDKGFWEDRDVNQLEEKLLAKLDTAYDSLTERGADLTGPNFVDERVEAAAILSARTEKFETFGFKNPRSALLLDFWKCVIDDLGLEPRFVIAVRNPLEVAKSLQRRNGFEPTRSLLLWAKYCFSILEKTQGFARVLVNYEALLESPEQQIKRLARGLRLDVEELDDDAILEFSNEFVDLSLKRFSISPREIHRDPRIPDWLAQMYDSMRALGNLHPDAQDIDPKVLVDAREGLSGFQPIAPLYDLTEALRADGVKRLLKSEELERDLQSQIDLLNAELVAASAREKDVLQANDVLAGLVRSGEQAQEYIRKLEHDFGRLTSDYEDALQDLARLSDVEELHLSVQDELDELIRERTEHFNDINAAYAELGRLSALERTLETIRAERDEANDAYESATKELEALAADIDSVRAAAEIEQNNFQGITNGLRQRLDEASALAAQYKSLLEERDVEYQAMFRDIDRLTSSLSELEAKSAQNEEDFEQEVSNYRAEIQRAIQAEAEAAKEVRAKSSEISGVSARLEVSESERLILRRSLDASVREQAILNNDLEAAREQLRQLQTAYLRSAANVRALYSSSSWRWSVPVRIFGNLLRHPRSSARRFLRRVMRIAWHQIPIGAEGRGKLAHKIFAFMPFAFKGTNLYTAHQDQFGAVLKPGREEKPRESNVAEPFGAGEHWPYPAEIAPQAVAARAIAFYLPQFHAIPENDEWWGKGFTEWTKVAPATPKFAGHYQPHKPGELGYYDLQKNPSIMRRQAELARLHGLSGFCFYFYWFGGKTLLEHPIKVFRDDPEINFPYCLCWANENWSRRWDGKDDDILIAQDHSPEDDISFIQHISDYLEDPNYIRVEGRPVLVVYRPSLLPDAAATVGRWREYAREQGLGELFIAYTQSFDSMDPAEIGFDAAIEFPPNNMGLEPSSELVEPFNENSELKIYDWGTLAQRSDDYPVPDYKLFRGVTPSWDNTARRPNTGAVMLGSTPDMYGAWLNNAVEDTVKRFPRSDERFVFINAWNEWAEGAHLEPDQRYGYAWLQETRKALSVDSTKQDKKILVVAHDLHKHGAQYLSLNMLRTLRRDFGYEVAAVAGGEGDLAGDFAAEGTLDILDPNVLSRSEISKALQALRARGFDTAIVNSCASGWISPFLSENGINSVGLVHELPAIISEMNLEANLRDMNDHCESVIFASRLVRDQSAKAADIRGGWAKPVIRPQGLYKAEGVADIAEKASARRTISDELGLPSTCRFVLGVGYGDHRKGVDVFVDWAIESILRWPNLHFVWLGKLSPDMQAAVEQKRAENPTLFANVHFPGFVENTFDYYLASDVYALSSREDPFPSTALEALNAATPVVLVRGCSGIEDLEYNQGVRVIDSPDAAFFVDSVSDWINDSEAREAAGVAGRNLTQSEFGFISFIGDLLELCGHQVPNVTAIVPNFNYAKYLGQRLASILEQTVPIREIVFLDDASTDDSLPQARKILRNVPVNTIFDVNTENSGNVFKQWRRGVEQATGTFVWIAEADDWAAPKFLETTTKMLSSDSIAYAYTQSFQVDQDGNILAPDYLDYIADIERSRWERSFQCSGNEEAAYAMAIKNVAPNVSGMLFRRELLAKVLRDFEGEIQSYRVAGDWCVYANLLKFGDVAFEAEPLNYHRRHSSSVTVSRFSLNDLAEIARMQNYVAQKFDVPQPIRNKATIYLDKLIKDFDLAAKHTPEALKKAKMGYLA